MVDLLVKQEGILLNAADTELGRTPLYKASAVSKRVYIYHQPYIDLYRVYVYILCIYMNNL